MAKTNETHKPRNRRLRGAIMRFSRARMIQKRAAYRYLTAKTERPKKAAKEEIKKVRSPRAYDSQVKVTKCTRPASLFSKHQRRLRKSIVPGSVLILLTGRHKGKRVIFLKQLQSGLLLVTGPFKYNGCPLRRVNQRFVIGTQTTVDISGIDIPERVNDTYFRRAKSERQRRKGGDASGDIFAKNKDSSYSLTEERKEDQKKVDSQLLSSISKRSDSSMFKKYLSTTFSLSARQYPHAMVF